ncbi:AAA family ATPase [Flavobacterium sp. UBA7663]|uniref:AAA family ATPase n=1 Tax=Flavobacterium sp. UBA7663 TaxID=1946557 RepID=UPI0025BF18AF|nr:AAA family ATPase [Flavobacterium sp. UBA7663]
MNHFEYTTQLLNYLDGLKINQTIINWNFKGKTDIAFGTPGGSWDGKGYLFENNNKGYKFIIRSIPNKENGYIVIESLNLEGQLYNIRLNDNKKFFSKDGITKLLDSFSMTVGYGKRKRNDVKNEFLKLGVETNVISEIEDNNPNWGKVLIDILNWAILREKVKIELKKNVSSNIDNDNLNQTQKQIEMIELLEYKKQIILQGPPGTGKTREAKLIAKEILGLDSLEDLKENTQFKLIQFHPSYTYEDFVRGIVAESKGDRIQYNNVNKTLGLFAKEALKNFMNSKKVPELISKEIWVEENYLKFKEDIEKQLQEVGEIIIKEKTKPKITAIEENALRVNRYSNENDSILVKDNDIIYGYIGLYLTEPSIKVKENLSLSKSARSGMYYLYQNLIEKFKKYLDKNKSEFKFTEEFKPEKIKKYILVIDEINRANLSSVLGELIYALEYRGEAVESMYAVDDDNQLILPPNLYIIGTMNTADRSVGHIDYAIRRRFAFVDVLPENLKEKQGLENFHEVLFLEVEKLFKEHTSPEFEVKDVQLGHSYFIDKSNEENGAGMDIRFEYEIKPILLEYVKDGVLIGKGKDIKKEIEELKTLL